MSADAFAEVLGLFSDDTKADPKRFKLTPLEASLGQIIRPNVTLVMWQNFE